MQKCVHVGVSNIIPNSVTTCWLQCICTTDHSNGLTCWYPNWVTKHHVAGHRELLQCNTGKSNFWQQTYAHSHPHTHARTHARTHAHTHIIIHTQRHAGLHIWHCLSVRVHVYRQLLYMHLTEGHNPKAQKGAYVVYNIGPLKLSAVAGLLYIILTASSDGLNGTKTPPVACTQS